MSPTTGRGEGGGCPAIPPCRRTKRNRFLSATQLPVVLNDFIRIPFAQLPGLRLQFCKELALRWIEGGLVDLRHHLQCLSGMMLLQNKNLHSFNRTGVAFVL